MDYPTPDSCYHFALKFYGKNAGTHDYEVQLKIKLHLVGQAWDFTQSSVSSNPTAESPHVILVTGLHNVLAIILMRCMRQNNYSHLSQ